ncbi:Nodulation protein NoeE [Folsomia candida]|uniref:Nodulation protein NoeE n=1 Tax=Folsomia candida TaxID=158441 RepID=A0A226ENW4_FOLCA|nr:Nodulation protein NoeE [Folsomia candida]
MSSSDESTTTVKELRTLRQNNFCEKMKRRVVYDGGRKTYSKQLCGPFKMIFESRTPNMWNIINFMSHVSLPRQIWNVSMTFKFLWGPPDPPKRPPTSNPQPTT